jgi:hypothetical protein
MGADLIAGAKMLGPTIGRTVLASVCIKFPFHSKNHYLINAQVKKRKQQESDEAGYQETLEFLRKMFHFIATNTVENVQHLTTGWIPHPPSCVVKEVEIPEQFYESAARLITENLGPTNLERVGRTWWQWRRPGSTVRAEWVEMKRDYKERMREGAGSRSKKVMFYVHGGAYFFGGIGHGPQIQRHARK